MRSYLIHGAALAPAAALILVLAACGASPLAPTQPAGVESMPAARPSVVAPASSPTPTFSGVSGGGHSSAAHSENIQGVVSAVDADARTLTVDDKTVHVPADATIVDGEGATLSFADLAVGDRVHVKGTSTGSTVEAESVTLQHRVVEHAPHHASVAGDVSNLALVCPDRTFKIGSTEVVVSATTEFARGVCEDLETEIHVEVRGTPIDGGGIAATLVAFDNPHHPAPTPPAPPAARAVTFEGAVTAVGATACPERTFTLASGNVKVTDSTHFAGGNCGDVIVGATIDGRGVREENGGITASQLRVVRPTPAPPTPAPARDVRVVGTVSGWTGSCPALTFTVSGKTVKTDTSTQFIGGSRCDQIANGKSVDVTGRGQTGGGIQATRVKINK